VDENEARHCRWVRSVLQKVSAQVSITWFRSSTQEVRCSSVTFSLFSSSPSLPSGGTIDLRRRLAPDLRDAVVAQNVAWETGDLVGAVRALDASIQLARAALAKAKPLGGVSAIRSLSQYRVTIPFAVAIRCTERTWPVNSSLMEDMSTQSQAHS
jgi:hypothetical protein